MSRSSDSEYDSDDSSSSGAPPRYPSLLQYAVAVLTTHDGVEKAHLTLEAQRHFRRHRLPVFPNNDDTHAEAFPTVPDKPNRPTHLRTLPPREMPPARKGVEHHDFNRLRLIHSLAHIESYAIDLSWDILVRFATPTNEGRESTCGVPMPREFYADWLRVAGDEAKHFSIWNTRLEKLGSSYGAMPVHDGLWQSADETAHSLLARLAVVHCVHEARGLDQAPRMLQQLVTYGDKPSAKLLEIIEKDELTHVTAGLKWFKHICAHAATPMEPIAKFHEIVRTNFRGPLIGPFNEKSRTACGFTPEWYLPLAEKRRGPGEQVVKKENSFPPVQPSPVTAVPSAAAAASSSGAVAPAPDDADAEFDSDAEVEVDADGKPLKQTQAAAAAHAHTMAAAAVAD